MRTGREEKRMTYKKGIIYYFKRKSKVLLHESKNHTSRALVAISVYVACSALRFIHTRFVFSAGRICRVLREGPAVLSSLVSL